MNNFPFALDIQFIIKIIILLALFLYLIFTFTAYIQVRALNKLVIIEAGKASPIVQFIFFVYFLSVISLFVFAIAIL